MRLHINIDHVATLRNARGTEYPSPLRAALLSLEAGADGITAHLREDRRHMRDADLEALRRSVRATLNMEMAATEEMLHTAARIGPDVITLVPERREERTTEGGLDVVRHYSLVEAVATMCSKNAIKLSTFIEASEEQILASKAVGATQVELHTGEYAHLEGAQLEAEWARLANAARFADAEGLEVAAGHGLTSENLPRIAAIPQIAEVNIGHAVVSDALFVGLGPAIQAYRTAITRGRAQRG